MSHEAEALGRAGGGRRPGTSCRGFWPSLVAHRTTAPDPPGAMVGGASTWVRSRVGRRRKQGHISPSPHRGIPALAKATQRCHTRH